MNDLALRQAGFSELSCQFAQFIARINHNNDPLVAVTAGLVSEAVAQGHVCLNLQQTFSEGLDLPTDKGEWLQRLMDSSVIGLEGEYTPLILTKEGCVYLYRYWREEQDVAEAIRKRCLPIELFDEEQLQQDFSQWNSNVEGVDWQKVAVLTALTRQFTVITGGPGTGKTTIVLRLLAMLQRQQSGMKIALAAPTGKAAARLQQAINVNNKQTVETTTLHRLLAISAQNEQGRYNADNPIAIDFLIVDEASMVDISLMAKLMRALPDKARLVLLGDSQQLSSVEAGAVLANLCEQSPHYSDDFIGLIKLITGQEISFENKSSSPLENSLVILQTSYRFDKNSTVGQLAKVVQKGDIQGLYTEINKAKQDVWQQQLDPFSIQQYLMAAYQPYFDAIKAGEDASSCLKLFEQFRVLAALKQGPHSVLSANELIEQSLKVQGWRVHQQLYYGKPIMVTQNDYRQRLFNGDTGLVLRDNQGELSACFWGEGQAVRWVKLSQLPAYETAYAMTIHKSQGSEFNHVAILLPAEESPLLNRELLYTAITRAKLGVKVFSSEAVLEKTVTTQHQRETGLATLLQRTE